MKLLKQFFIFACCLLPMLFVAGCDIMNPIEGVKAILNTKARTTSVTLVFIDTKSDTPIGLNTDRKVKVSISGRDSDIIIDLMNRQTTEFVSSNGFVSFAIRDEIIPDRDAPIEFMITARSDDYLTVTKRVKLKTTRTHPYEVNMVPSDYLPTGVVGSITRDGMVSNGQLEEETRFETPVDPESNTRSVLTIPQGTAITTENGQDLSGELTATFYHFSNSTTNALASFPGGLSGTYIDLNGNEKDKFFTTAGFINIRVKDDDGRVAKYFSNPVEIVVETSEQTEDLNGNPVALGTPINVWSMDSESESGIWQYELETSVSESDAGKYATRFETDHLTYFTTGWTQSMCAEGTKVNIVNNNIRLRGKLYKTSDDSYISTIQSKTSETEGVASYFSIENVPPGVAAYLELHDVNGKLVKKVHFEDLCDDTEVEVDLSGLETITATFKGTGICESQNNAEVRPSFPAWYTNEANAVWVSAGEVVNGELDITLPGPAKYEFGSYYEDEFVTHVLDLNNASDGVIYEETIVVPEEYCENI